VRSPIESALAASGSLAGAASIQYGAAATLAAVAVQLSAAAILSGTAALNAAMVLQAAAAAILPGVVTMAPLADVRSPIESTLAASGALAGTAILQTGAVATLAAVATLIALADLAAQYLGYARARDEPVGTVRLLETSARVNLRDVALGSVTLFDEVP